jgi:hypothetical protein
VDKLCGKNADMLLNHAAAGQIMAGVMNRAFSQGNNEITEYKYIWVKEISCLCCSIDKPGRYVRIPNFALYKSFLKKAFGLNCG